MIVVIVVDGHLNAFLPLKVALIFEALHQRGVALVRAFVRSAWCVGVDYLALWQRCHVNRGIFSWAEHFWFLDQFLVNGLAVDLGRGFNAVDRALDVKLSGLIAWHTDQVGQAVNDHVHDAEHG